MRRFLFVLVWAAVPSFAVPSFAVPPAAAPAGQAPSEARAQVPGEDAASKTVATPPTTTPSEDGLDPRLAPQTAPFSALGSEVAPDAVDAVAPALTAGDVVQPMVKTVVALAIVLLLAWLTLHKGMGRLLERAQAGKRLKVVERVALDARRSLFLVEVDGRTLVVGGGDLVRLDAGARVAVDDNDPRAAAFGKVLAATHRAAPAQSAPTQTASPQSAPTAASFTSTESA